MVLTALLETMHAYTGSKQYQKKGSSACNISRTLFSAK